MRLVQWRERHQRLEFGQPDRRSAPAANRRAAVHDAMSDPIQGRLAAEMCCIPAEDRGDRTSWSLRGSFIGEVATLRIDDREARCGAYPGDLAMNPRRSERSAAVSNTENLMLDEPALMTRIGSCIDFKSAPVLEDIVWIAELILEPQLTGVLTELGIAVLGAVS